MHQYQYPVVCHIFLKLGHYNVKLVMLINLSSMAAPEVVNLTTSGAASDDKIHHHHHDFFILVTSNFVSTWWLILAVSLCSSMWPWIGVYSGCLVMCLLGCRHKGCTNTYWRPQVFYFFNEWSFQMHFFVKLLRNSYGDDAIYVNDLVQDCGNSIALALELSRP